MSIPRKHKNTLTSQLNGGGSRFHASFRVDNGIGKGPDATLGKQELADEPFDIQAAMERGKAIAEEKRKAADFDFGDFSF